MVWLTLVAIESIHGVMRRLFLETQLGDLRARHASAFTGAVLIASVFGFTLRWPRPQPVRRWWAVGLPWMALTLAFEIGVGRATGMSWDRIASDFDPRRGGLLAFGMLVILVHRDVWRNVRACFGMVIVSSESATKWTRESQREIDTRLARRWVQA